MHLRMLYSGQPEEPGGTRTIEWTYRFSACPQLAGAPTSREHVSSQQIVNKSIVHFIFWVAAFKNSRRRLGCVCQLTREPPVITFFVGLVRQEGKGHGPSRRRD